MDSVKWLTRILVLDEPFAGHFQANDYRLFPAEPSAVPAPPVGRVRTNSLIAWPATGAELPAGEEIRIVGYAWTGEGAVRSVEWSDNNGVTWQPAQLVGPEAPHAWRLWEAIWRTPAPGACRLAVRAADSLGGVQPEHVEWNAKGYANNSVYRVELAIR
jgi:hypothetical protein